MSVSDDDAVLRERIELLRKKFEEGKISIASQVFEQVKDSLLAVRADASGQVDLSSVDGRVRSLALAVGHFDWRDKVKSNQSIRDVQEIYFEFIHRQFLDMYEMVVTRRPDLSVSDAAKFFAADEERRRYVCSMLPEFLETVRGFWTKAAADAVTFHLQDASGLKTVFGGDLFPVAEDALISTSSIYSDTVIVPEPFLQSEHVFATSPDHLKAYYFFKSALNLCSISRLALADVDPPIVCVLPAAQFIDSTRQEFQKFEMIRMGLAHASILFGRDFASEDELWTFARGLSDVAKLKNAIVRPERFLLDAEFKGTFEEAVARHLQQAILPMRGMAPGLAVVLNIVGRMGQANDLLAKARDIRAVPIVEAPTSWQYLMWRFEYGADLSATGDRLADEHVLRSLVSSPDAPCSWIGKIPDDALIELRRTGALADLRSKLSAGVKEIVERSPSDYEASARRVYGNIDQILSDHAAALRDLKESERTFAGTDLLKCVVYGSVSVASAIGVPLVSLVNTFVEQSEGVPKLGEIPKRYRELKAEAQKLHNSVAGVMFEARKRS